VLDARVWLLWALSVMVTASSARNPLYMLLLLMVTMVVNVFCTPTQDRRTLASPLRFALVAVPLAALFNGLSAHLGETVLFRLPGWLPLLGGPVTLEALVFGASNGLALTTIFSAFSVFNRAMPVHDLVKLTPRAFHEAGVVLSIALTFIPQTLRSFQRIRDAQLVRGHRVRGLRDWIPIVLPLTISGLERSMGLAEAMVARGYGATADQAQPRRLQALLASGLVLVLGGWLAWLFLPAWRILAGGTLLAGAGLVVAAMWLAGRAAPHTDYRPHRWTASDTLVLLGCGLALAMTTLPLPLVNRGSLYYTPYPRLSPPAFDPLIGLGLLGLLAPTAVAIERQARNRRSDR